jgi:hypothetical protein
MNRRNPACTANLKPFKKGDDPRRNKGCRSKEAVSFAQRFANSLATGGTPEELSTILWTEAKRRRPWAIEMIMDRLIGKPKENENQPVKFVITYQDKSNGNAGN